MNYEEKIDYAEPVVIEKKLMQHLIDSSHVPSLADTEAANKFLNEFEVVRFENPMQSRIAKPFGSDVETECVTVAAVKKETIKAIDALEYVLDESRQEQWRNQFLQDCKSGKEIVPLFGVDIEYENIPWHNPLDEEEMDYLTQITPTSFVLDPKAEPNRVDMLDSALATKFGAFLNKKNGEIEDDKYYCAPEFRRNEVCYYGNLRLRLHEADDPVKTFGFWDERTQRWTGEFNLHGLNDDDQKDIKETLKELPEKLSREAALKNAKDNELFWKEFVTSPIERILDKLENSGRETVQFKVKEQDRAIEQVIERDIREKAAERWKAMEEEQNRTKEALRPENRKAYEVLLDAYSAKEDLKNHPRLQKALEKQLLDVFVAAQSKGISIALNEYSMDAPSRNQTTIQVKQPARDREKQ